MKGKKIPLWLILTLGLCLAIACIGTTWLIAASYADPELYAKVTDPVKDYVSQKADALDEKIKEVNASIDESIVEMKDYMQEQKESFLEKKDEFVESFAKDETPPDLQALSDSVLASPRDIADPVITDFSTNGQGQEIVLGGSHELIYYNQTDEQWGNYGSDSIHGYGCGPTATAMVVSTLTHFNINPQEMSDIFYQEGYWASRSGTYHDFALGVGEMFSLDILSLVPEEITSHDLIDHLMSGKIAIALMTTGHFTNYGHFIVLRGVTLSGDILVADPASRDRTLTLWSPDLILEELSLARNHGTPLWLFSPKADQPLIEGEE